MTVRNTLIGHGEIECVLATYADCAGEGAASKVGIVRPGMGMLSEEKGKETDHRDAAYKVIFLVAKYHMKLTKN